MSRCLWPGRTHDRRGHHRHRQRRSLSCEARQPCARSSNLIEASPPHQAPPNPWLRRTRQPDWESPLTDVRGFAAVASAHRRVRTACCLTTHGQPWTPADGMTCERIGVDHNNVAGKPLDELQPFIGEWSVERRHVALPDAVIRGRSAFEWWGDRGDATLTKRRIAPRRGRGHDSTVTEPINGNQQVRLSGHAGTCTWPL